jgi:hypothetical protein
MSDSERQNQTASTNSALTMSDSERQKQTAKPNNEGQNQTASSNKDKEQNATAETKVENPLHS